MHRHFYSLATCICHTQDGVVTGMLTVCCLGSGIASAVYASQWEEWKKFTPQNEQDTKIIHATVMLSAVSVNMCRLHQLYLYDYNTNTKSACMRVIVCICMCTVANHACCLIFIQCS